MATLDLTLEKEQTVLRIVGNIVSGWTCSKVGYAFRGRKSLDYVNDTRLIVHLDVRPPNRIAPTVTEFPADLQVHHGNDRLSYELSGSLLTVCVDMPRTFQTLWNSGKLGVCWRENETHPILSGNTKFWLSLLVYVEPSHRSTAKVTWERDLLPFLPGGHFESQRARH